MIDRLSIRSRPPGRAINHQWWGKLLFLHWRVPERLLRPLLPERLTLDTHDGAAWISLVPFTMWGIRHPRLPALPLLRRSHKLNVRTYVHLDRVPGVWFLSLDAANPFLVAGGRLLFGLPYFQARMSLREEGHRIHYRSRRMHPGAPRADFSAVWEVGDPLPTPEPDSLDFFLTERYCLYSARGDRLYRSRIRHEPWPLAGADLRSLECGDLFTSQGLPAPEEEPRLHAAEKPLSVEIWPLERA